MKNAKNIFWVLIDVLIVLVVIGGLCGLRSLSLYNASLPSARTMMVSAEAKTTITPDITIVSFSIVAEGREPEKLQADNTKKMIEVINFAKEQGLADKDIQTAAYTLWPRYEYDEKKRQSFISGYTFTQSVTIKIRDFTKVSTVVGRLPSLGVNQIQSVSFEVENSDKYLESARKEAFQKALDKARSMAQQNGTRLGRVVSIMESSGNFYPRPYALEAMGGGSAKDFSLPQIEPGSEELTVNVSVTYELR